MWNTWSDVVRDSCAKALELGDEYFKRIKYEHKEIIKQGANEYWLELLNNNKKYDHNKNGLILPFIYGLTDIDPIKGTKKLFINGKDHKIEGIEITLKNGTVINTSKDTLINTNRGYIRAKDISEDDEIVEQV